MSQQSQNEAASAEDVALVIDTVNDAAMGWAEFAAEKLHQNADDTCYREGVLLDRRAANDGARTFATALAISAASDLQGAIRKSLIGFREDSVPGVLGHKWFGGWLIDHHTLGFDPAAIGFLLGGPAGAGLGRELLRDHLPLRSMFVDGGPRRAPPVINGIRQGVRLAPGVWVWAPGKSNDPATQGHYGHLCGWRIRDEYWDWKHWIEETVSGLARPLARWELRQLVGGGVGDMGELTGRREDPAWVWQVGDPIDSESLVGMMLEQEQQLDALIIGADLECKAYRADEAELLDWTQDQAERDRDEAERESAREAEALGVWQRVAMLGLGALVLIKASKR